MSKLVLYLLEASAALTILYSLYLLLLRKETFFSLNRFFLLTILVCSFLFPLVSFDFSSSKATIINEPIEDLSGMRLSYYDALESWSQNGTRNPNIIAPDIAPVHGTTLLIILLAIYAIGLVATVFRLIWTYTWIYRLKVNNPHERMDGTLVVKLQHQVAPFSFINAVFVHEDMLNSDEFDQIMAHEKTHIRQRHSYDLIFVQLLAAMLWFNPVVWFLIKSLKTTHEYIADKKMINQGYSLVEYQSLLLRQLISNNSFGLVHNFNLSFIKKRITMMKIKESGWTGKVKVAIVLSAATVFSLVIVACNSKVLDDSIDPSLTASGLVDETNKLGDQLIAYDLPVLPETGYKFDGDLSNSLEIIIHDDEIIIDGQAYEMNEIASVIKDSKVTDSGIVVMKVGKEQPMSIVRDVQWALRKADRRKLLYIGQTSSGEQAEMAFLLPPVLGSKDGVALPMIDDDYAKKHNMDLLKIQLGNNAGMVNQQQVYDFVKDQMLKGKSNYVVSAKHEDDDSYGDYLLNLTYIQEGFNQIYQERAQEMFGKNFYDLDKGIKEEKEQYLAVRKGIPRAISIAEKQ